MNRVALKQCNASTSYSELDPRRQRDYSRAITSKSVVHQRYPWKTENPRHATVRIRMIATDKSRVGIRMRDERPLDIVEDNSKRGNTRVTKPGITFSYVAVIGYCRGTRVISSRAGENKRLLGESATWLDS